jgi:hypothetical protein
VVALPMGQLKISAAENVAGARVTLERALAEP